jgi:hypothetical protein
VLGCADHSEAVVTCGLLLLACVLLLLLLLLLQAWLSCHERV